MRNITLLIVFIFCSVLAQAQTDTTKIKKIFNGVTISGDWFIANSTSKIGNANWHNEFVLKRSYFTIKKCINDYLSIRYTQDITLDKEGEDAGNVETRMKYLYLKIKPKTNGFITNSYFEVGMVHQPWLTYEQKVNLYRVEGNMSVERNGLMNSACLGVLTGGNIGPQMGKEYLSTVNNSMNGKYLSYAVGVYNGGGYNSFEQNSNKVVEGIINVRPLSNFIPQIQLTHAFNIGKGNTIESPDFQQFLFHGGYFGKRLNISAQYHFGKGDFQGEYVDILDKSVALGNRGYSFFGEYRFIKTPFAIFVRYDHFEIDNTFNTDIHRQIAGIKCRVYKKTSLVLTGSNITTNSANILTVDLNLQISF